jgi:hypothetical protein
LRDARALVHQLKARVTLGINLEADSRLTAGAEAKALTNGIGRHYIQALELGNEPELYNKFTWWHTASGQPRPGRPPSWDFPTYLSEYSNISQALPQLPLAGPAVGLPRWTADLSQFIAAEPRVRIVTLHRYPLQLCYVPPGSHVYPTIAHLLSPAASSGLADSVIPSVELAHADGLKIRIDEFNSISCGQAPRVGRSFASALWALQTLFAFARVGVDGVDVHTYVGSTYALFRFHHRAGAWTMRLYPEYYGLLLFARAAPRGSRLLRVSGGAGQGVHAWATRGPGKVIRVTLINEGRREHTMTVKLAHGGRQATVQRLTAPSLVASGGVTLGGQSLSPGGVMSGTAANERVTRHHGAYTLALGPGSAALLTVHAKR